jgi:hypothetical protein
MKEIFLFLVILFCVFVKGIRFQLNEKIYDVRWSIIK